MNRNFSARGNHRSDRYRRSYRLGAYVVDGLAAIGTSAMVAAPAPPFPSDIDAPVFPPSHSGRHRLRNQSSIKPPPSRPLDRRRHRKPRPASHPRFVATVVTLGATAFVGASLAPPPPSAESRVETMEVRLTAASQAATPNPLLAALVETCSGAPGAAYCASTLANPDDLSAALAALVDEFTKAVQARVAGTPTGADPTAPNAGDITLWLAALPGLGGTAGNVAWAQDGAPDGPRGLTFDAASLLQTVNQLGPLAFALNNLGLITFSQNPDPTAPTGERPVLFAGDMTSWVVGLAGLASSTGTVGGIFHNTFGSADGGVIDATGILQTANRIGPLIFNLAVIKGLSFVQPPNGTALPDGQLDAIRAVDIGQWAFGIPGLFMNTGTVGFVTGAGCCVNFGSAQWVGGLQTTFHIGPFAFTLPLLPAFSYNGIPPTTSTTLTSDLSPVEASSDVGARTTAFAPAENEPTDEVINAVAPEEADAGNEADPAGDGSAAIEDVASTAPSPLPTATATAPATTTDTLPTDNGSTATEQLAEAGGQTPVETTNPTGATTPKADSDPDGARHSAATDGYVGRHRADDGYVGQHRADNGYVGQHRADNDPAPDQNDSGTDGSGSTT